MDEIGQWLGRTQLRPFRAVCQQSRRQGAVCPWRQLGPGIRDLEVSLTRLCDDRSGALYVCNRTLTPACDDLCDRSVGPQTLSLKDLQSYLDFIVSRNPFGGDLEPWDVPQVDLTEPEAYVFVSQRQALYTALRTLALKLRDPTSQALAQGFEASLKVESWIQANPVFETVITGAKLKCSACPVAAHAYQSALTDDSFGISFKQPLTGTERLEEIQAKVDYLWVQRLELPIEVESGWRAIAILPSVTFAQGEAGQQIRLDFFDGSRLLWTVQDMIFDGVLGETDEPQEGSLVHKAPLRSGKLFVECSSLTARSRSEKPADKRGSYLGSSLYFKCDSVEYITLNAAVLPPRHSHLPKYQRQSCEAMEHWFEVESLAVTNIIDNDTDFLSTAACNKDGSVSYQSEVAQHVARGDTSLNFPDFCSAAHGLSLLLTAEVTTTAGREKRSVLLDAGPCPRLWEANAKKLQVDLASVECIVLSHYHADHSGGLTGAVPLIASARQEAGRGPVHLDLHQDRPESRAVQLPSGTTLPLQPETPTFEEFRQLGADLVLSKEPHVVSDCFFVSGEIPRQTCYEKGLVGSKRLEDNDWRDDNDIDEERYVAVKVKDAGVVVFSSCSHAGIVNVCRHARDLSGVPLLAAMGGFHLGGAGLEERVRDTIHDLVELRPKAILPGHCTGWRAKIAIAQAMPGQYIPALAGGRYIFSASKL
ncbi:unnamed protein product [Symbiodinium sp. CCMP2592]|nr:unnamed protein product [Symbiodinium sp. CCMP2592]